MFLTKKSEYEKRQKQEKYLKKTVMKREANSKINKAKNEYKLYGIFGN
jgi:hypothetical protein